MQAADGGALVTAQLVRASGEVLSQADFKAPPRAVVEMQDEIGVALPTIKSQLRSLMVKMGVSRQAELVARCYHTGAGAEPRSQQDARELSRKLE